LIGSFDSSHRVDRADPHLNGRRNPTLHLHRRSAAAVEARSRKLGPKPAPNRPELPVPDLPWVPLEATFGAPHPRLTGRLTLELEGYEKSKVALTKSVDHRGPGRSPAAGVETVTPKPSSSHVAHSRRRSLPITPPNWRQSLRAFFRSPSMASASILSSGDSAITATPLKRGDRRLNRPGIDGGSDVPPVSWSQLA
jgi:hypothetical protein